MFLWDFFQQIQTRLGYNPDLGKYKELLSAMDQGIIEPAGIDPLLRFCRLLFLQEGRHREQFEQIFKECWEKEMGFMARQIEQRLTIQVKREENAVDAGMPVQLDEITGNVDIPASLSDNQPKPSAESKIETPGRSKKQKSRTKYFHPQFNLEEREGEKGKNNAGNNMLPANTYIWQNTDEYFPISRRQMLKGWQFIRLHVRGNWSDEIDVPKTVRKLARQQFIVEPEFKVFRKQMEDSLLIFADYRGSMTPFHELTNRIIHTARELGIIRIENSTDLKKQTSLCFFQNYPIDYVYKTPTMMYPERLDKVFSRTNSHLTMALIISDAGAARGHPNQRRVEATSQFLKKLKRHVKNITWLNPMPRHRWEGTSAGLILRENPWLFMFPVFEQDDLQFQRVIQSLFSGTP